MEKDIVFLAGISGGLIMAFVGAGLFLASPLPVDEAPPAPQELFDYVFDLTEQLLKTYQDDEAACAALSFAPDDPLPSFTYDIVLRLTLALHELTRQRQEGQYPPIEDLNARLERMAAIAAQSIAHAKRDLWRMANAQKRPDKGLQGLLEGHITAKNAILADCQKLV